MTHFRYQRPAAAARERNLEIRLNAKTLALVCQQMRPLLAGVDPETLEAVSKLIDPLATFKREHAFALAVAYFNELQAHHHLLKAIERRPTPKPQDRPEPQP